MPETPARTARKPRATAPSRGRLTAEARRNVKLSRARTPEAKEGVRQALIAAGRALIAAETYSDVSLKKIASAAGYTAATIYQYFSDKDALLMAIREIDYSRMADEMQRILEEELDPDRRIFRIGEYSYDFWRQNRAIYGLRFVTVIAEPEAVRTSDGPGQQGYSEKAPAAGRIHQVIEKAVASLLATIPGCELSPALATDALMGALHGVEIMPEATPYRTWSDGRLATRHLVAALIAYWRSLARPEAAERGA